VLAWKVAFKSVKCGAMYAPQAQEKAPPTEFRIFAAGVTLVRLNECERIVYDAAAEAQVLAAWRKHGADVMIDLEHFSILDPKDKAAARADAVDARGWCKLAARNGELWAVNVRWTPDGARRLMSGAQRYVSPVFSQDEHDRPTEIVNIALCAMPAMCGLDSLIAASAKARRVARRSLAASVHKVDPEKVKAALEALKSGDGTAALAMLEELIASAASGGAPPADDALNADLPSPDDSVEEPPAAAAVAASVNASLASLTASVAALASQVKALSSDRNTRELDERRGLIGQLIKLGVETPALAWQGDPAKRIPVARLSAESVESLRGRVAAFGGKPRVLSAEPPEREDETPDENGLDVAAEVKRLSASTLAALIKRGEKPEDYVRRRALTVTRA
jgi:phage I-like protein